MYIDYSKNNVPLKNVLTQVWPLCLISTSHAREPCRIICHFKKNMGVLNIFLCVYIHVYHIWKQLEVGTLNEW